MANYTLNDRINFIKSIYNDVVAISNETGISLKFILAQIALETGWGVRVLSGTNNLFNIKADSSWTGPTATFTVREYINGEWVYVESEFRVYTSYEESIRGWLNFLQNNPRYNEVFDPNIKGDLEKIAQAMENAGYATDPLYAEKIIATAKGPTMWKALYTIWAENSANFYGIDYWQRLQMNILIPAQLQSYTTATSLPPPAPRGDPLILDLDGDGTETTAVADGAYFDHDSNGFAERTGWAGADDGLLVWDRNGDGIINNGRELFGDQTILKTGVRATNGFQALAEWDSNIDGKIDINDAIWPNLKIWRDFDGDGYSSGDEFYTLNELGIASLNTGYANVNITDPNGNIQTHAGAFRRADGTTGQMNNYALRRVNTYTIANEWLEVPVEIGTLPDLQAYGNVYDLQQAMVRDGSGQLKVLVEQFIATTDVNTRNSLMEQILFKWTGSDGISPTSRGPNIDARKLTVLEKFFGEAFVGVGGSNPNVNAIGTMRKNEQAQNLIDIPQRLDLNTAMT